jgi:hypothetical protein
VGAPGPGHVRHNLLDWNGILGSSSDGPREPWEGNEYALPWSAMLKSALTLGIWDRSWRHVAYTSYPETGPVEAEFFRPERWKPHYPNPAHDRMRPDDALWAARIVMRFSDEAVRAIVHTGEYSNPAAEAHLADTLIRRRDKVLAYHLSQINPLSDFRLEGDEPKLLFRNLGREAGLATETTYEYAWFSFDNDTGRLTALGSPGTTREPVLALPAQTAEFFMVRLRTRAHDQSRWGTAVDVAARSGTARGRRRAVPPGRITMTLAAAVLAVAMARAEPAAASFALRGKTLELHLYGQRGGTPVVLVSGDGGWIHLAPQTAPRKATSSSASARSNTSPRSRPARRPSARPTYRGTSSRSWTTLRRERRRSPSWSASRRARAWRSWPPSIPR